MRTSFLIACVTAALLSGAGLARAEHRPGLNLTLRSLPRPSEHAIHPMFEPASARGSDMSLRLEDMISHAENTIIAGLEQAQHLGGGKYRTWLWVTPVLGSMNGVTVRFDYR